MRRFLLLALDIIFIFIFVSLVVGDIQEGSGWIWIDVPFLVLVIGFLFWDWKNE